MNSTRYFCQILMRFEFSRQMFEKVPSIKFHQNPSSGSRVVPCGQKDMTKQVVAFRNFANAPKTLQHVLSCGFVASQLKKEQEMFKGVQYHCVSHLVEKKAC